MPIRVVCPECDTKFKADDDRAGKRAACPECGERVPVPDAEDDDRDTAARGRKSAGGSPPRRDDEDAPKKKGGSALLIVGVIAGVLLLVCGGGVAAVYFLVIKPGMDAAERIKNELLATASVPNPPPPTPAPPATKPAPVPETIRITAVDLTDEFDQDAAAAAKKYQGKKLRVTGITNTSGGGGIELHIKGKTFTQPRGRACYVVGKFEGGNRGAANAVPLRTEVTIVGQFAELKTFGGNNSFTVYLKDCRVEK